MSLLPSKPDTSAAEESAPRVVGVDSEDADALLDALSSATAREILTELHDDPAPASELADRVDTSLQNVQYHLENLADAGAVEVVDTVYSAKGREMDVYAPADRPLVIFAGDSEETGSIRATLRRLLGGIGALALGSVVVQSLVEDRQRALSAESGGGGDASGGGATTGTDGGAAATEAATERPGTETAETMEATPTDQAATTEVAPTTTDDGGVGIFGVGEETTTTTPPGTTNATTETALTATETTTDAATTATETARTTAATGTAPTATPTTPPPGTTDATTTAADVVVASGGPAPGLLFFAGGVVALVAVLAFQYVDT